MKLRRFDDYEIDRSGGQIHFFIKYRDKWSGGVPLNAGTNDNIEVFRAVGQPNRYYVYNENTRMPYAGVEAFDRQGFELYPVDSVLLQNDWELELYLGRRWEDRTALTNAKKIIDGTYTMNPRRRKSQNPRMSFSKVKIGGSFELNGSTWIKKSNRTAYIFGMPHRWFYFSNKDVVFTTKREAKEHERSLPPRYLNPRKNPKLPPFAGTCSPVDLISSKNPWQKKPWGYLGYGAMKNFEIAENADARMSGGKWRLQSPTGYGRWKTHGNGTLAEMKQLAKQIRSKPKRKASKLGGIDLGFDRSNPRRRKNPRMSFSKVKIGGSFELNGSTWIKKSSRTAYIFGMPHRWFYFSKNDIVFTTRKEAKEYERSQPTRYLNPRKRKNGRQYDHSEYIEFLYDIPSSKVPKRAKKAFEREIDRIVARLPYNRQADDEIYYLALGSLAGHGVGLWEGREAWHKKLEEEIKYDLRATNKLSNAFSNLEIAIENRR